MVVSLEEVKAHLRIEDDEEDNVLMSLISQAQAKAEDFCRVSFEPTVSVDENGNTVATVTPEPVRLAVLLMVSYYFENRDTPDHTAYTTMRTAFENLLYPHRDVSLMF